MTPVLTKLNLYRYIDQVRLQKAALLKSTLFEPAVLQSLSETYDVQERIALRTLNHLNGTNDEPKEKQKMHTLVFGTTPAKKMSFFREHCDKKNAFIRNNYVEYQNSNCYISNYDSIAIYNIESMTFLKELVMHDFLEVKNVSNNDTHKIHTMPMIIGCNFPQEKLTEEILNRCNIVTLD